MYESIIMKAANILSSYSFETASSQLRKTFKSFVERLCLEKKLKENRWSHLLHAD